VVNQFEELLTQTGSAQRARFAELLRPALTGPIQLVATLRPSPLADPDLAGLPTHVYPLRPLRREALHAVIEKPAQLAGIEPDDGLVDRLVDDTDSGEALPLLAFTLAQLARGGRRPGAVQAATTVKALIADGTGMGSPRSRMTAKWPAIASRIRATHSS